MFPLKDNILSRTTPFVNYLIILACAAVFIAQLREPREGGLIERYGLIPARVFHPDRPIPVRERVMVRSFFGPQAVERVRSALPSALPPILTLLTCMFLHGGWIHVIGNMWFLFIFGDNVEDRLGHLGYLLFYLFCGLAAGVVHLAANPGSGMPTIGASGAIAGVMGAYLLLYPRAQVLTLMPVFFFLYLIVVPAPLFLGFWFLIQFFQGALAIHAVETGGVAWWAHIGGFAAGFGTALLLKMLGLLRPPAGRVRFGASRPAVYRYRF